MIQSLRATLLEEFLGTEDQALEYHKKALELDPSHLGAQEKLERSARRRATEAADPKENPGSESNNDGKSVIR